MKNKTGYFLTLIGLRFGNFYAVAQDVTIIPDSLYFDILKEKD